MKRSLMWFCFCCLTLTVQAQVPQIISYQGYLAGTTGVGVTATLPMTFRIFSDSTAANPLLKQIFAGVQVTRGVYSVVLDVSSLSFTAPYWLEVEVGGEILSPRTRLTCAPYALRARASDTADYAKAAPGISYIDSSRIAGTIPDNIVTSAKIFDGTIQRSDVQPSFKAPYSDTADAARNVAGIVPVANGGTGSSTQNFVDLTSDQDIGGAKRFSRSINTLMAYQIGGANVLSNSWTTLSVGAATGTGGSANCFVGDSAGYSNAGVEGNTFVGSRAGRSNFIGIENSFFGRDAGFSNQMGVTNSYFGSQAGFSCNADGNSFFGYSAGYYTTQSQNSFFGADAGYNNSTGRNNTFLGCSTGWFNTTGRDNTYVGFDAYGSAAITNASAIGDSASVHASNTMVFGNVIVNRWGFGVDAAAGHAIEVGTNSSNGNGAYLTIGGTWTNASDRNKKENFTAVDGKELLIKIERLPISMWNYKGESQDIRHIGPMAQDFYGLFHLGNDDKHISTIDPAGVALAAIQELTRKNEELTKRVSELESLVKSLAAEKSGSKSIGETR
ncbi:MAG: tail fiber domain-containing protein [Bacteroidota bacterium]